MYERASMGIRIDTQCQDCLYLEDYDYMCKPCSETQESKLSDFAHDIVDEGNIQYRNQWFINREEPSGHDWVESITIDMQGNERREYMIPIVNVLDGGTLDNLWELDDETQRAREVECKWCHILTPKLYPDCQDCDKPLELNV
jgi:hypothetical protein